MATTISFGASSPYSLALTVGATGGATTKTRSEILAYCAEGPLKTFLYRTPDWTVLNPGGALCDKLNMREIVNRAAGANGQLATSFEWIWTANGVKADATGTIQVDIRLQTSARR